MCFRRSIEPPSTFLIVQTGSTLPALRARHGDFPRWFQRGLGLPRAQITVVRADAGQSLPTATAHAGVIVTGSPAMVSERLDWSERTADWLREAVRAQAPVRLQLLAHALGGRVDDHPVGREVGTVGIERLPAAADDALLGAAPARFLAHASHRQSVLALPSGAVALARSAHDPHHAVRYAPNARGLQFHPEFSVEVICRLPAPRQRRHKYRLPGHLLWWPRRRADAACAAPAAPFSRSGAAQRRVGFLPARRIAASGSPSLRPLRYSLIASLVTS